MPCGKVRRLERECRYGRLHPTCGNACAAVFGDLLGRQLARSARLGVCGGYLAFGAVDVGVGVGALVRVVSARAGDGVAVAMGVASRTGVAAAVAVGALPLTGVAGAEAMGVSEAETRAGVGVAVAMGALPLPPVAGLVVIPVEVGDVDAGGVGLAVAVVAALWDTAVLAEWGAVVLAVVEAEPEQPVSASPAATPRPVINSAGREVTRGVFEEDRISLLLDVVPAVGSALVGSALGNTARALESCAGSVATFHPTAPYMHTQDASAARQVARGRADRGVSCLRRWPAAGSP